MMGSGFDFQWRFRALKLCDRYPSCLAINLGEPSRQNFSVKHDTTKTKAETSEKYLAWSKFNFDARGSITSRASHVRHYKLHTTSMQIRFPKSVAESAFYIPDTRTTAGVFP